MKDGMISLDEFEYRTMLGCTDDACVFGLGQVQWMPTFMLSPTIDTGDNPFCSPYGNDSVYLHPKLEMTVSDNDSEYRKTLSKELNNALFDHRNKTFWNPVTGDVHHLSGNFEGMVTVDSSNQVHISARGQGQSFQENVSLDQLMASIQNPRMNTPKTITISTENPTTTDKPIDYGNYSVWARKIAGWMNTAQKPFAQAIKRLTLYNKIIAPGGTKLVFPFVNETLEKLGNLFGNKHLFNPLSRIGIELSNSTIIKMNQYLKWGGRGLAIFGAVAGGWDIMRNGLNYSNGIHTVMTGVAIFFPEVAGAYFTMDMIVYFIWKKDLGTLIGEGIEYLRGSGNALNTFTSGIPIFIDAPIQIIPLSDRNTMINQTHGGYF